MKRVAVIASILIVCSGICFAVSFNRIIYPIKTKDATGFDLVQDQAPDRIISASPAITEILYEFKLEDKIVGVTENCDYPEEAKKLEHVGGDRLDSGKAVRLQPDLILVRLDEKNADIDSLRKMHFNEAVSGETVTKTVEVFAVNPTSMGDIIRNIFAIGTVTNREHSAYSLTQKMKRGIAWVEARAKSERKYRRYKALVVVSRHPLLVAGDDTYYSDMLRISGLINVAPKGQKGYVKMSRKDVEKADPDIIIASTDYAREPKDVYGNWDFCNTSAGKNKKALVIDRSVFYRPGPRVVKMLEDIAGFAYEWRNNEETE